MSECPFHARDMMCRQSNRADIAAPLHFEEIVYGSLVAAYRVYALLLVQKKYVDVFAANAFNGETKAFFGRIAVVGVRLCAYYSVGLYLERFPDIRISAVNLGCVKKVYAV